jgi:hypothetical protein
MNAIEKRLATLEGRTDPPGDLFASIHLNDPYTFPPGRIGASLMQNSPAGAAVLTGIYADTEAAALAFIRGKTRGRRSPVTVFYLQGGGWTEDGKNWQAPDVLRVCHLLPGGRISE